MRLTLTSLSLATALALAGTACKKTDDRDHDAVAKVGEKPIEAANDSAERVRDNDLPAAEKAKDEMKEANEEIGEKRADLAQATTDARKELGEAFTKLRTQMRDLQVASASFAHDRDQVAAEVNRNLDVLDQRLAQASARATTLTGDARADADKKATEAKSLAAEARADAAALKSASAENWEKARDEALDSLEKLYDRVAETSAEVYTK
jgi:hypothetical protein